MEQSHFFFEEMSGHQQSALVKINVEDKIYFWIKNNYYFML